MLLLVVNAVLPIIILVLLGFLLAKTGVAQQSHAKSLNDITLYLFLPALLIHAIHNVKMEIDFSFLTTFFISSILSYILMIFISSFVFKSDWQNATAFALCASSSNIAYIGIPILTQLFGYKSILVISLSIVYLSGIIQPISIFFLTKKINIKKLLLNPLLVSSFIGLLFSILHLNLPSTFENTLMQVGNASIPCILVAMGINLYFSSQMQFNHIDLKKVTLACLNKLILHPLLAACLYFSFSQHSLFGIAGILAASLPTINSAPILCEQGNVFCLESQLIVTLSTVLSLITLPLLILLIMPK